MSEIELKSGYFNAILDENGEPDISYEANDLNNYFEGVISPSGVFYAVEDRCQVVQGNGLNVVVKKGKGHVNNHWFKITEETKLELSPADVILDRKDRIIVRWSAENRNCVLTVLEGVPSSNPVEPMLTQDETSIWEISLASVLVKKNATTITTANITDERPSGGLCGWITGVIDQLDTTELFNQYQAAQNEFIEEKTTEYNEFIEGKTTQYNEWFSNIQEQVKATSLYREYEAIYRTVSTNETTIAIPTSINYVHNSLDVLSVHVDGKHLMEGIHYEINAAGTNIILNNSLSLIGTEVIFVNKKSIDGTAAESLTIQVENLQEEVNALVFTTNLNYNATGTDDNIAISNIVKNFLNASGDYSAVGNTASMYLHINGALGIESLIDDQMVFDFHNTVSSNRKAIVDFGNATINLNKIGGGISLLAIFGSNENVIIENANIVETITQVLASGTIYGFHGGNARNCNINISTRLMTALYGAWNVQEFSNNKLTVKTGGTCYGIYEAKRVQFNDINAISDLASPEGYAVKISSQGFVIGNKISGTVSKKSLGSSVIDLGNIV